MVNILLFLYRQNNCIKSQLLCGSLKVSLKYPLILLNELGVFPRIGRTLILLLGNSGDFSGWDFSKGVFPSRRRCLQWKCRGNSG